MSFCAVLVCIARDKRERMGIKGRDRGATAWKLRWQSTKSEEFSDFPSLSSPAYATYDYDLDRVYPFNVKWILGRSFVSGNKISRRIHYVSRRRPGILFNVARCTQAAYTHRLEHIKVNQLGQMPLY